MSEDIVERIRSVGRDYDFHENALIYEAADEIERLRASEARLREDYLCARVDGYDSAKDGYRDILVRLEAKTDLLREALRQIAHDDEDYRERVREYREIARAALGEEKK